MLLLYVAFLYMPFTILTGVPKNVAFQSAGLSTHTLPGMLQLV